MTVSQSKISDLLTEITRKETPLIRPYKHIALFAPSCAGKSSLIKHKKNGIIAKLPYVYDFSISACTRDLAPEEIHGVDYYKFSHEDFHTQEFLESNEYSGNGKLYGTLYAEVERIAIKQQKRIVLDVDINGAIKLKSIFGDTLIAVFIDTEENELRERFEKRKRETPAQIEARIIAAREERRMVKDKEFVPDFVLPYRNSENIDIAINKAVLDILNHAYQPGLLVSY